MRHLVEKWDLKDIGKRVRDSIKCAINNNLLVNFMTEDTTRAHPNSIDYLFNLGIDNGATIICISDTVGVATPWSTYNLVSFIKEKIVKKQKIKIDWHGHNDRGLALANSLIALSAGANRIHATALGIGERAGNTSIEELMVNMHLLGVRQKNLKQILRYTDFAAKILKYNIPPNKPILGSGVFNTATGIHAAAIKKALAANNRRLAGIVYSFINPKDLGRDMDFLVGPLSGKSNLELILRKNKITISPVLVEKILNLAKRKNKILNEKQVLQLLRNINQH